MRKKEDTLVYWWLQIISKLYLKPTLCAGDAEDALFANSMQSNVTNKLTRWGVRLIAILIVILIFDFVCERATELSQ